MIKINLLMVSLGKKEGMEERRHPYLLETPQTS
jgi:hypothetical protein